MKTNKVVEFNAERACLRNNSGRRRFSLLVVTLLACVCVNAAVIPNDEQVPTLQTGWNWIGFFFLPTSRKVGDVLGTTGWAANDVIQSNTGSSRFNGTSWIPSDFTIEYGKLYMVNVSKPVTVTIKGAGASSASLAVAAGWNWIANPTAATVVPSQLKHSGGWTAGDRIQGTNGTVTYTGSKWVPSTGFMLEPGKGYQIYSAKSGTISF